MRGWKKIIATVLVGLLLLGAGAATTYLLTRPQQSLPTSIQSTLRFSPLVVAGKSNRSVSGYQLSSAEDGTQTLSYRLSLEGASVTLTQYVQPSQFTDVPEYKERFLSNVVKQTSSVQTAGGVIYLGRSETLNKQIGVMLEHGLIVFLNPSNELPAETWRTVGDALVIERASR